MLKKCWFLKICLKGQEGHEGAKKNNDGVGRGVWEGVGGPSSLVWRFWEVWRVCCLVSASTCLEARGHGGFKLLSFEGVAARFH